MRAKEFLLEYSRAVTAQKLGAQLLQKFRSEPPAWQQRVISDNELPNEEKLNTLLNGLETTDPTPNSQYVQWMIRAYVNDPALKFEDLLSRSHDLLVAYYKLVRAKRIPAPNNDIGRIPNLAALEDVVNQNKHHLAVDKPKQDVNRGGAKEFYRDQDLRIIVPEDRTAACYYGQGTKWCTAATNNNMFDSYHSSGPLYIIVPTKPKHPGEKYQFQFETNQFMDESDNQTDLSALVARYPQLLKIFGEQAQKHVIPELMFTPEEMSRKRQALQRNFPRFMAAEFRRDSDLFTKLAAAELGRHRIPNAKMIARKFGDDIIDSAEWFTESIMESPNIDIFKLTSEDYLYDTLTGLVQDWSYDSDWYMILQDELEDVDEDHQMEVSMDIQYLAQEQLAKMIKDAVNKALSAS